MTRDDKQPTTEAAMAADLLLVAARDSGCSRFRRRLVEIARLIERQERFLTSANADHAKTDDVIRQQALRVLPAEQVYGNSNYVPGLEEIVKQLVDEIVVYRSALVTRRREGWS